MPVRFHVYANTVPGGDNHICNRNSGLKLTTPVSILHDSVMNVNPAVTEKNAQRNGPGAIFDVAARLKKERKSIRIWGAPGIEKICGQSSGKKNSRYCRLLTCPDAK
jgi:hypothetical protein